MCTDTDFRSNFVKMELSQDFGRNALLLSLVQYFYKLPEASSKIVLKVCRSPVLLKLPEHSMKIVWLLLHGLLRRKRVT